MYASRKEDNMRYRNCIEFAKSQSLGPYYNICSQNVNVSDSEKEATQSDQVITQDKNISSDSILEKVVKINNRD